jgi:adenylate cyclase
MAAVTRSCRLPATTRGQTDSRLQSHDRDLRAKDRIKETFGKFVDPRIVANLIDPAGGNDLAERQVATVFFWDIRGFSGLGELLTATTLVKLLNTYFSEMTTLIHARNAIIEQTNRRRVDGVLDGAFLS